MMHLTMKCVPYCRISVFTLYVECYESVCSRFMWYATASAFTLYVECYGQCVHAVRGMLRPVRSRYTWNATVQCVNAERGMLRPVRSRCTLNATTSVFTLCVECYGSVCSRCTWNATASVFTLYVECYGQCVHELRSWNVRVKCCRWSVAVSNVDTNSSGVCLHSPCVLAIYLVKQTTTEALHPFRILFGKETNNLHRILTQV